MSTSASPRNTHTSVKVIRDHLKQQGSASRYDQRRIEITEAAAACFETRGVAKTSITVIAEQCVLTRELVYYYFANKRSIIEAVVDLYAAIISNGLLGWAAHWSGLPEYTEEEQAPTESSVLGDLIAMFRSLVLAADGSKSPMVRVLVEVDSLESAIGRACDIAVGVTSLPTPQVLAFIAFGVVGLLLADPQAEDEKIERAIWQLFSWRGSAIAAI